MTRAVDLLQLAKNQSRARAHVPPPISHEAGPRGRVLSAISQTFTKHTSGNAKDIYLKGKSILTNAIIVLLNHAAGWLLAAAKGCWLLAAGGWQRPFCSSIGPRCSKTRKRA